MKVIKKGIGQSFKKVVGNTGDLHEIGEFRKPLSTMTHKELFSKKGALIF